MLLIAALTLTATVTGGVGALYLGLKNEDKKKEPPTPTGDRAKSLENERWTTFL